jgi:hypothetical protein
MSFKVEVIPILAPSSLLDKPVDWNQVNSIAIFRSISQEFSVVYRVNDRSYAYYPSHILTTLGDLNTEWELSLSRTSHEMTLSGYTILNVKFQGGDAIFFDVDQNVELPSATVYRAAAEHVEREFARATSLVWNYIVRAAPVSV